MGKLYIPEKYGQTPNKLLNNSDITLKAKGLFGFLQSKPNGWKFSAFRISKQTKDGPESVRTALKELEENGCLKRKAVRDENGKWNGYDYYLLEPPKGDKPSTDNPSSDKPSTENHITLSNKDISNKDISNKEIDIADKSADTEFKSLYNEFIELNPHLKWDNKTERKATQELLDKHGFEQSMGIVKLYKENMADKYCPVATKPTAFVRKMGDLAVYFSKLKEEENNKPKTLVL